MHLCTLSASAVKELAKGNKKNQDAVAAAGAIAPLVAMLSASQAPLMQANAAGALANLARNHPGNQHAIARTGAVGPLCTLLREGSDEAKDRSASAMWSLAADHSSNKDTIAKLGGIDPLLNLLITGTSEHSQECIAGALCALASKHLDNRTLIAKRLVGLLASPAAKAVDRALRVLMTCSSFANDCFANQAAIAKSGAIVPLITWLESKEPEAQVSAAQTVLCVVSDNTTTQSLVAKAGGIVPLITLVRKGTPKAQDYAAQALWHLASQQEHHAAIIEGGAIKPFVSMLGADSVDGLPELAALIITRMTRMTPEIAVSIEEKGGVVPLVALLTTGAPGAAQWSAAALAELALVTKNRDAIANAGGIPRLVDLLMSTTYGSPETAARCISHLALAEGEAKPKSVAGGEKSSLKRSTGF